MCALPSKRIRHGKLLYHQQSEAGGGRNVESEAHVTAGSQTRGCITSMTRLGNPGAAAVRLCTIALVLIASIHGMQHRTFHDFQAASAAGQSTGQIAANEMQMHNPLERFRIDNVASDSPRAHSAVSLTINDTILRHSGQWVEVCWHNLPFPSAGINLFTFIGVHPNRHTHITPCCIRSSCICLVQHSITDPSPITTTWPAAISLYDLFSYLRLRAASRCPTAYNTVQLASSFW
jgi:hypothetical protein